MRRSAAFSGGTDLILIRWNRYASICCQSPQPLLYLECSVEQESLRNETVLKSEDTIAKKGNIKEPLT